MDFAKFQQLVEHRTGFRTMDDRDGFGRVLQRLVRRHVHLLSESRTGRRDRGRLVLHDRLRLRHGDVFAAGRTRAREDDRRSLAITDADIEAALGGYPEKKKDYPERSRIALQTAIEDYRAKRAAGTITDAMLEAARASAAVASLRRRPATAKPRKTKTKPPARASSVPKTEN